ncbi:MAG: histidine kinase [Treponemataceae bacterium]|nr:histidine kinase [Treponemataceae bacterium]
MKAEKRRHFPSKSLPLKTIFYLLIIGQSFLLLILSMGIMKALSSVYQGRIARQAEDTLMIFSENVDMNLYEIEQYSYDILSNYSMQNDMHTYLENPGTYEAHEASVSLYDQLFATTMNRPCIAETYFIFPDGRKIRVVTDTTGKVYKYETTANFLNEVKGKAQEKNGSGVWHTSSELPGIVAYGKVIRSIYEKDGFSQCGILIFILNGDELLSYPTVDQNPYQTRMACYVDGARYVDLKPQNSFDKSADSIFEKFLGGKISDGVINTADGRYVVSSGKSHDKSWQFIQILDLNHLLDFVWKSQLLYIILFLAVTSLILFVFLRVSGLICSPLAILQKKMKEAEKGNFSKLEYEKNFSIQEINDFTANYNALSDTVDYLINQVYKKQILISDIRYKMLQKQINPHFLYNTLETIHWKAFMADEEDIASMALSLSRLLRSSLKKPDMIPLREEIGILRDYIRIQKYRFEERLDYDETSFDEKMTDSNPVANLMVPKMILQPVVENSIKHNLEKNDCACRIQLEMEKEGDCICIRVTDSGTSADPDFINHLIMEDSVQRDSPQDDEIRNRGKTEGSDSFGLKNVMERLKICYEENVALFCEEKRDSSGKRCGTSMIFRIPFVEEKRRFGGNND